MPYYYGFDTTYIVYVLPALLFALWAQFHVKSVFSRYGKVPSDRGMTGRDAARLILDSNGLYHVQIVRVDGELTDHFDPRENVIRLSNSTYDRATAAAVGVAAHEAGHAVQYAQGYVPMKLRSAIIPATNIGSNLAMPLVLLGIAFSAPPLAYVGVLLFAFSVLFQLVTLPVEFNASHRALSLLEQGNYLNAEELKGAKSVLSAAALTYVASMISSALQLLRLLVIARGRRRDD